jgi:hypothetical protein
LSVRLVFADEARGFKQGEAAMTVRKLLAGTIYAAAVMAPMAANAACTLGNVAGKWQIYAFAVVPSSTIYTEEGLWARCTVQINAAGVMGNTTCTSPSGQSGQITNGKVQLSNGPNCTYTASFKTSGQTYLVSHATLAGDRQTMFGVGKVVGFPFTFQLVKIVP